MVRSVIAAGGLMVGALLACTAPNPAYHIEDLGRPDPSSSVPAPADAGRPPDAARPSDAAPLSDAAGPPDGPPALAGCGSARPELADLVAVDSLAIDRAGNIYFSNDDYKTSWIGKLPPSGARADKQWLTVTTGLPTRGMAIDGGRNVLYYTAGAPVAELQAVDLGVSPPQPRTLYRGLIDPNDLVVGPDGSIYVGDQGDNTIYRFTPAGARTPVNRTPIGARAEYTGPAGLSFAADGTLVVGMKANAPMLRLTLANGMETSRRSFGMVSEWANGVVHDERGRIYVALFDQTLLKDVVRLDSETAAPVPIVRAGHYSSMAFGRGQLDCHDLYVSDPSPGATVRRMTMDARGLPVP